MPIEEYGAGFPALKAVTIDGNTSGTKALVSSGTLTLAGFGNVTLSQVGNAISISGGGGTAAGSFSAGVSSDGNTLGTTGTVSNLLKLVGGSNITLSESSGAGGATVTWLGNAPFSAGVSNLGNTLGTTGTVSKQVLFVGGNNITLSQSSAAAGATITISGANVGGAQTGISGVSASDTVYTSGTVKFTGSNMITVKSGAGQAVIIDATQSVQPAQTGISGISASDTLYTSGTVRLSGSNNVTVRSSAAGQTIVIDASFSQSTQTYNVVSAGGNTSGAMTSFSTGTIVLMGGNNITLSQDSNSITISGPNVGGAQTGISGISASDTLYTSGTVKITGSNIVTVKSGTGQAVVIDATVAAQTAESQTLGASNLGNTSGTSGVASGAQVRFLFAGGNNITLSQSINGASGTITISGANVGGAQTGISGISASNTVYTSGTVKFTGSNLVTVRSGTGQAVIIDVSTTQSVQTQNVVDVTAGGNTSGTLALVSSGTLTLAGGNNVTLSQVGNAITISGAEGGGAGISTYGNTAGTTGIAGSQLVIVGGSNITLSQSLDGGSNNATLTIIGASGGGSQSTQTYNVVSASGNTSGTLATFSTGTVVLAGGSNITLSQSSNTITIIGASGGTGGGFQLTAGGNTSGTLALISAGTLTLAGGNNITLSQVGSAITISGANVGGAQTGISSIQASDATYTSGKVIFTGTNNITVASGTGQQVIISGPTGGGAGMGSAGGGNTSGTSGTVGKELYLYPGANISLSQSVNGSSASLSIVGAAAGTGGQTAISGISASDTLYTSGTVRFTGSNAVTIKSGTGQLVVVDASFSQSAQTGISGIAGSGASTVTAGTVQFANSNNISFGLNGSTMTASFSQSVQPAQTGISGLSASDTVYTSGTVKFTGSNIITVKSGTGQAIILDASTSQSIQTYNVVSASGNTSGTLSTQSSGTIVLAGGSNITLSQSSNTISIIGASGGTGGAGNIVSASGNTSGTLSTQSSGTIVFAGGNNITLSQSSNTITISAANQTVQTQGMVSINGSTGAMSFNAGANMSLSTNGSSLTFINVLSTSAYAANVSNVSSGGTRSSVFAMVDHAHLGVAGIVPNATASSFVGYVNLSAGAYMSLASGGNSSAGSIQIINKLSTSNSAANIGTASNAGTGSSLFAMYDHVHRGVGGIAAQGTATTFVGSVVISAGNNITLSTGGNSTAGSIAIHGGAGGAGIQSVGISTDGNTAGTTGFATSQVQLVGGTNITLSQTLAGGIATLTIVGPTGGGAGMGTGTNTSGTSGTVGKELRFYGNSNIGLSQSVNGGSASLTIIGQAGGGGATVSEWMPPGVGYSSFTQQGQSALVLFPAHPPYYVTASRADLYASIAVSTSSNSSFNGAVSFDVGVFTRNASTLSLASSGSTVHTWNVTRATSSDSISGWRLMTVPINVNMTPGEYWIGVISRTATTNANWFTASNMALVAGAAAFAGPIGATNATNQFLLGMGVYSAQTAAMPSAVGFSEITATSASTCRPIINFVNVTA